MIEQMAEIATRAGPMDAFVTHPEEGGPFPAVIVYMDIWGLREELFAVARRIATVGYHCTVPNLYYRQGKVRFEKRDVRGRMVSHYRAELCDGCLRAVCGRGDLADRPAHPQSPYPGRDGLASATPHKLRLSSLAFCSSLRLW